MRVIKSFLIHIIVVNIVYKITCLFKGVNSGDITREYLSRICYANI